MGIATRLLAALRADRRASYMLEFAIVGPVFLVMLFIVFEVSYDLFLQAVLDNSLQITAREMQVGTSQAATEGNFVSTYFCSNSYGLLDCNNLFIQVQEFAPSTTCPDLYDATSGDLPVVGGVLQLGSYYSALGAGLGSTIGPTACLKNTGFCSPGPNETIVATAIYVAPSFLQGLLSNNIKYNGGYVRAALSTAAFQTEAFQDNGSSC